MYDEQERVNVFLYWSQASCCSPRLVTAMGIVRGLLMT